MKLYLTPHPSAIEDNNGIGRIVLAQRQMLPALGVEFVDDPAQADVTACHIEAQGRQVDCVHVHGLYYQDVPHEPYLGWHHEANRRIAATARVARRVTVPSQWVAETFRRDMRIDPVVIGHGINPVEWAPLPAEQRKGYALWNKGRGSDVCDPMPAWELARRGVPVVTTFAPTGRYADNIHVTGPLPYAKMQTLVKHASVGICTTPETFGIGTVEMLAAGVPILGYKWAGTADIVTHGIDGWLVEPGDIEGLHRGWVEIQGRWAEYSTRARHTGLAYTWDEAMQRYAALYQEVAEEKAKERHRVCVVVTSYNYGQYLRKSASSALSQLQSGDELRIVNDGSTDDTHEIGNAIEQEHYGQDRIEVRHHVQSNQGVAAARNNGIEATDCEYIICLDADDQLAPEYINLCREALRADRGLGIAYTGLGLLGDDGRVHRSEFPPPFDWETQASPGNPPRTTVPTAAMFRRSMWERAGGYKQVHAPGEDAEFYTRGLSVGYTARKVDDEPLIWYRNHAGGASKTRQYKAIDPYHPWMKDKQYPFAAPADTAPRVLSYHRPLISIVIPVGPGHARYLPAAIDSLLMQTYRGWECIVVDDTGGEARDILKPYPFARYQSTFRAGEGPSIARNMGLEMARAPLVMFLDADDWLTEPDALRLMLAEQAKSQRYVYTDWVNFELDRVWEDEAPPYSASDWFVKGQHAVTALIPTEWVRAVGGFDETLKGWEDWDFFAKLAQGGYCGHRLERHLLAYRKHSGTMRNAAWEKREQLAPLIRRRFEGVTPMPCKCGPSGLEMLRIRQEVLGQEAPPMIDLQPGQAVLEYTGNSTGIQRVNSRYRQGVKYEYGGNSRTTIVWEEDIDFLLSLGIFRRFLDMPQIEAAAPELGGPAPTVASEPVPEPVPVPAAAPLATPDDPPPAIDLSNFAAERLAATSQEKAQQAEDTIRRRGRPRKNG